MNEPGEPDSVTPELRDAVQALYADLAQDIAAAGPVCDLSGRCCRFVEWDHVLFLSQIEADLLVADAPPPHRPLDDGATCPWQDSAGRCDARGARPLGCRIYYCDPTYQDRSYELSETYLGRLRSLTAEFARPWNYAPLHQHLKAAWRDGGGPEEPPVAPPAGA